MGSVNGKVALITGGARGIGAGVARRLHGKGAKLVLIDVDEAPLKELAGVQKLAASVTVVAPASQSGADGTE